MTPADLARELGAGKIRPVYLVLGDERYLADKAIRALRDASLAGAVRDFNEEQLIAGDVDVDRALSAARTVPMMAARRFVHVRSLERWEPRGEGDEAPSSRAIPPLDRLAAYAEDPVPSTCLVLSAAKLDNRRRLVVAAKKGGFWVSCEPLDDQGLARFIEEAAAARGCSIGRDVARLLAQIAGPELGYVADAVERLTLYVGAGGAITEDAVSDIVVKVRETSVFALVDAVARRDVGRALSTLSEVYDPRDRGLPLVGMLAWSVRQALRFAAALRGGARPEDAAKAAGAPPFKAKDLAARAREVPPGELERWLTLLADADLALKGSKRPPRAVLETLVIAMARGGGV